MDILIACLAGAALVMDTSVAFQVLVSQPIIASTIIGWLLGNPQLGLELGLLLQLLWIGHMPVGAHIVPAGNFASILSTIVAVSLINAHPEMKSIIILLVIGYALLWSYIGAKVIRLNRNYNVTFFDKALKSIDSGNLNKISIINFTALGLHYVIILILILVGTFFGNNIYQFIIDLIPVEWNDYARFTEYAVLGVGVGLTVPLYKGIRRIVILSLGAIIGMTIFIF